MRLLIVSRYKSQYTAHVLPFVEEQFASLRAAGCEAELFLLQGNCLRQWISLCRKIQEYCPDVIHAHYGLSCLLTNLATRRIPVVSTYHGSDINVASVRRYSKMAMRLSAWNVFVSKRNMSLVGAKEGEKCSLIPCGVALSDDQLISRTEARKALGWGVSDKKILFAGAFDNAVKDPELAKVSVSMLDGAELIELKGYSRGEVNTLMCAVDCLLMTSKTEGSPQVIKEAMACGCPVVSVDVGEVAVRTSGVEGCFVVSGRDPKNIAENIKKAMTFEGKTNGREKILECGLTIGQVAKRIMEIYNKVL